jgi:hypothetical protein
MSDWSPEFAPKRASTHPSEFIGSRPKTAAAEAALVRSPPILHAHFCPTGKSALPARPVLSRQEGGRASSRTWEGMRWTLWRRRVCVRRAVFGERTTARRRTAPKRTAKPCGPDTRCWCQAVGGEIDPTGFDSAIKPAATVTRRIRRRGERGISRKAIAQGMPGCSDCTCMLVCAFLCALCTRDRGCSVRPAFPAPSSRENVYANLGQIVPREDEAMSGNGCAGAANSLSSRTSEHSERRSGIHTPRRQLFGTLVEGFFSSTQAGG